MTDDITVAKYIVESGFAKELNGTPNKDRLALNFLKFYEKFFVKQLETNYRVFLDQREDQSLTTDE